MPPLKSSISGYVAGDKLDVTRTVTGIPVGRALVKAWFTIKSSPSDPDPGLLQKVITTVAQGGVGQITDDGATDQQGALLFQLTPADTATPELASAARYYDIQLKFDNGDIATLEYGWILFEPGVTGATT